MSYIIPHSPKITIERNAEGKAMRYCVDANTEGILQRHRAFAMAASGILIYSAWKMKAPIWMKLSIAGIGVVMYRAHSTARKAIQDAEKL